MNRRTEYLVLQVFWIVAGLAYLAYLVWRARG
jgi:hypothetical protein